MTVLLTTGRTALAQGRGIPLGDLPPFPETVSDTEKVAEVSVYGAASAEEEVVVGAAKREQSLGTVASAVTVVTSDQLHRYGYRSLAEALRGVAGIYIVDDRMVERVGIRGVQNLGDANTRILVLIDGTPLNEPWSQFVDSSTALPVNIDDVSRIEVIRGPVSSIYGTNAFLGIINIVTLEADKAPRAYGRTTVDTYGTFGGNAGFGTGGVDRQVRGTVTFAHRFGESLDYPDFTEQGFMSRTSADAMQSLFASVAVNYDRLFAQVRAYDRARELPGAPYDSIIGSTDNENRDQHALAEVGYTHELGDRASLAGRVYADRYRFTSDRLNPDPGGGTRLFETIADSQWYGGEVRGLVDVLDDNLMSVTAGLSLESTETTSTSSYVGAVPVVVKKDFTIAGVYGEAISQPTEWLGVTAGLRYDVNSEFTNEVSPRAALFLHRGDAYGMKLLYAQGFRNPSIQEAYFADGLIFDPALQNGATLLHPETITSYEVVAYGRPLPGVKVRVSGWEWRIQDPLRKSEVFLGGTVNARRVRFQNESSLVSRGVELEGSYRNVAGVLGYANATVALTGRNCLAKDGIFDNPLLDESVDAGNCDATENAPNVLLQAGGSSPLLMELFHASTEMYFISERGTQDPAIKVKAYLGWNIALFAPDVSGFDITVGARNLLGREDVPAQSDYNRKRADSPMIETTHIIPGPGREIFARLGYRF